MPPRIRPALLLLALLAPLQAAACTPQGSLFRCPPGTSFDPDTRPGPLTREDIDARIGTPGAPISDAVADDVSRAWKAVRRQPNLPVIAYPPDPTHMERKGDMP